MPAGSGMSCTSHSTLYLHLQVPLAALGPGVQEGRVSVEVVTVVRVTSVVTVVTAVTESVAVTVDVTVTVVNGVGAVVVARVTDQQEQALLYRDVPEQADA